jgi:hypothetical protein
VETGAELRGIRLGFVSSGVGIGGGDTEKII